MSVREYKSSVFTMLEEIPEYALSTYNALNGTSYEDPGMITIQKVKAFDYDIYGRRMIPIPTPKFVVFYNGLEERPEQEEFHLSDSYEHKCECYDLDLSCVVYNINPGFNEELQQKSRVLLGYTTFVEKVRLHENKAADLRAAINRAIDECIKENILAEFFMSRRAEVLEMAVLDFTFERREKLIARDSREEGLEIGRRQGRTEGKSQVAEKMLKANKPFEEIIEFTGLSEDALKELAGDLRK